VFLSGGQDDRSATERLAAIRAGVDRCAPWTISFSFGRALQTPALHAWRGNAAHIGAAQAALLECARRNGQALRGGG
jgi:fructose-bisphosphate aldolase class I